MPLDNLLYSQKLKQAEDAAMRQVEVMPRVQQLIALKYLPVVLGRRENRDYDAKRNLDDEIRRELER